MDARRGRFVFAGILSVMPVLASGVTSAAAEHCFAGGYSCVEAAKAATDFRIARDCSTLFAIKPARRSELTRIIDILRHRPMVGLYPEQFSDTPQAMTAGQCERVAEGMRSGTPDQRDALKYLVLRPDPARHPGALR